MKQRLAFLLVPCLLLVAALTLAACGGDDSSGEEAQIEGAIETSVTSTDPSKCTELMTASFRQQNSGGQSGDAALEECEEEAGDTSDDPDSIEISAIEVDGSDATAQVSFVGGGFDGQALDLALVKEGERWKLDEIVRFASLDADALATSIEKQFKASSGEIPAEVISCVGDALRDAPQEEIEELLLSGSSDKFVEFAEACE